MNKFNKIKHLLIASLLIFFLVINVQLSFTNYSQILANPFEVANGDSELPHILWSIETEITVSTCYECQGGNWMACQCTREVQYCIMDGPEDCISWTIDTGPDNCVDTGAYC